MRSFIKFILRPLVRSLVPLLKELYVEEFEISGINERNQRQFLAQSATIPASVSIKKGIVIINNQNNPAKISFGDKSRICENVELRVSAHSGEIKVGSNSLLNSNCHLHSMSNITIGNRVLLSYNVSIFDNNSHPLDPKLRAEHWTNEDIDAQVSTAPVIIEDDVWIGANVTILKGVTIGKGSIIAANSVVTDNVESLVVMAGNPAKKIKTIAS